MSSRQSREKERSRLRMDNYSGSGRTGGNRGRPSPPRRREVDNVVKKARKETSGSQRTYWDKKILEAEEKDPNRWRHSGFKELYLEDPNAAGASKKDRDSSRSRSRSPLPRRSPPGRSYKSPPPSNKSRPKKPMTPPPRRSARSESVSSGSLSSCSDSQCSVCLQHVADDKEQPSTSAREKRPPPPKEPKLRPTARSPISRNPPPRNRSRSRSFSVPRSNNPVPVVKEKPRKKAKKRDREKKKKDKQRAPTPIVHIKQESFSDDSSSPSPPTPRMTLSERFGKMAQWSVDRDLKNHRNLRITSGGQDRTLRVEMDEPPSPPMPFQPRPPASNHALMEDGSWDDVRVRYAYYKEQGYLRDLTLADYIKWEEWWYKYQDWLDNERYFEARAAHAHPHARRRPPRPTLSITPPPMHGMPHHGLPPM
uniref:Serine/arginine repetitive matrix protein 1 n=3 Tax=Cacopsylla melanoneura TaxID=428564 RepID=A0A8D8S269_9HEMI